MSFLRKIVRFCAGISTLILVEGSAGVGKSLLIADLLDKAREQDQSEIVVLVGVGDAIEQTTPYLLWQPILQQIADRATALTVSEDRQARTDHVTKLARSRCARPGSLT